MTDSKSKTKKSGDALQVFANQVGRAVASAIITHGVGALEKLGTATSKVLVQRFKGGPGPAKAKARVKPPAPAPPVKGVKAKKDAAPQKAAAAPVAPQAADKAAKRTSTEVDATALTLLEKITKDPGLTMEELAEALGITTAVLQLPLGRLFGVNSRAQVVGEVKIHKTGRKRATRYFPGAAPTPPTGQAAQSDDEAAAEE